MKEKIESMSSSTPELDALLNEITKRNNGNRIASIKDLRDVTDISLSEAKEIIDTYFDKIQNKPNIPQRHRPARKKKEKMKTSKSTETLLSIVNFLIYFLYFPVILLSKSYKTEKTNYARKIIMSLLSLVTGFFYFIIYLSIYLSDSEFLFEFLASTLFLILLKKALESSSSYYKKKELKFEQDIQEHRRVLYHAFRYFFSNPDMMQKLNEFILTFTMRYDLEKIDYDEYEDKLVLFGTYINEFGKVSGDPKYMTKEIENLNTTLVAIDSHDLERFIDDVKESVYIEDMLEKLNYLPGIQNAKYIEKYVDIYGDDSLLKLNLKILSKLLSIEQDSLSLSVTEKLNSLKKKYKINQIETQLFSSQKNVSNAIEYVDTLTGYEFEDYLKKLFMSFGYSSENLPYSNDFGADLIISKGFSKIVIQAKNYVGNVGNKAVQEVHSAKSYYKCDVGIVITNSHFTLSAQKTADATGIILIDREKLEKIIVEGAFYFNTLIS